MLFKLIKEKDVIIILKENDLFVVPSVINVIIGVGIDFHYTKLTKFYKLHNMHSIK